MVREIWMEGWDWVGISTARLIPSKHIYALLTLVPISPNLVSHRQVEESRSLYTACCAFLFSRNVPLLTNNLRWLIPLLDILRDYGFLRRR